MSAYTMLAEQSPYAAPAFTTADAVTTASSFDGSHALSGDFMGFGLTADEEPVWNMSPISPSFANWNAKIDAPFVPAAALDRDFKHTQVRNGQPTPPLDDNRPDLSGDIMTIFETRNSWDDTPTPPSSEGRARNSSLDNTAFGRVFHTDIPKRRRLREHKHSIATTMSSGGDSEDQGPDQVKREKFLERNRLAASKCRQKKKEHTMMLESQFKEQSDKKARLNSEISQLRSEILGLKNEVLRHAQCGDEPIKLHLAQMVKQIASKDRDDPSEDGGNFSSNTSPAVRGSVSFGFEESLPLENATTLEHHIRRDSEASIAMSGEANEFDDLLNV